MVAATPYPSPAGSRLLQDLGFLAFTLPEVTILMPTKNPRGQELSLEEQRANQALNQRRLRNRACQQQRQALSDRQRPDAAVEGRRPRSRDGNLLCPA